MAEQDIKMNQFQTVTDADYVYVEKGNNQGKIKKSDLQGVLAKSFVHAEYNVDELQAGEAYIHSVVNGPVESWLYVKTLAIDNYSGAVQIAVSVAEIKMWVRTRSNNIWTQWKAISFIE